MLDPMKPRRDQLACVEQLEMRRAGNVMRVADLDDGLRAREREPEVDLQRGRAVADIDFRLAARLIRIAGHDRVGRVRGMLAVDVRPRRENARSRAGDPPRSCDAARRTCRPIVPGRGTR